MRIVLLAALLAAVAPVVLADVAATPARQFIDKTYISLPKSVGIYSLDRADYDPEQWVSGVSGRYSVRGGPPRLILSLYVYPQGKGDEAQIVDEQIDGVEQGIRQHGDYTDVEAGPRERFVVPAPAPMAEQHAQGKVEPIIDSTPETEGLESSLVRALKESAPPTESVGRRQVYTSRLKGEAVRSVGFVFYRHLQNIKVRITAPAASLDQAQLDSIADAAARALVPAIQIENFGTCGDIQIDLPGKGSKKRDTEDTAVQLVKAASVAMGLNCASSPGPESEAVREGFERRSIEYPAGIWKTD